MVTNVLDQASIADAINRQKVGSQRTKNEMMRRGTQDPGSFAMNNQQQISQAQQPQEFWGAGRKETPVGTDESLIGAIGGTKAKLGGQDFYYSPYDVTKASWGTQDADDIDLGGGKYNIMHNGSSIGTGYKSLADTIKDYQMKQYTPKATQQWQQTSLPQEAYGQQNILGGGEYGVAPEIKQDWLSSNNYRSGAPVVTTDGAGDNFSQTTTPTWEKLVNGFSAGGNGFYGTEAEALQAQQGLAQQHITGNTLRDWETLGQILNYGGVNGNWSDSKSLGGNNLADNISGLNTLYGSKPIIYNGKLLGYSQQGKVDPISNQWNEKSTSKSGNGWTSAKKETTNWDTGYAAMGRQYNDQDWWSKNSTMDKVNSGRYTVTADAAANSPGWKNADAFARDTGSSTRKTGAAYYVPGAIGNSLFGSSFHEDVGKIIDPILNYFTPTFGGSTRVGRATDALGNGGSFGDSYDAATADGWAGAGKSLLSQALSDIFSGVDIAGSAGISNSAIVDGFSPTYAGVANGAISGAIGGGLNGGTQGALRGAAGGALGGLGGGFVSGATESLGQMVSKMAGGAAQGGINSLFNKNSPIAGSLYGAMSGGLHGYLNSTNNSGDNFSNSKDKQNKSAAQAATSLAKTIMNMRKNNGSSTANR